MIRRSASQLLGAIAKLPRLAPASQTARTSDLDFMHSRLLCLGRRSILTPTPYRSALHGRPPRPHPLTTVPIAAAELVGSSGGGKLAQQQPLRSRRQQPTRPARVPRMEAEAPAAKKARLQTGAAAAPAATAGQEQPAAGTSGQARQQGEQQAAQQQAKPGKGPRKKNKERTPESLLRQAIQMAARDKDIAAALAAYDKAKAEGMRLPPDCVSHLLFLCALGEDWEASVPKGGSSASPTTAAQANGAGPSGISSSEQQQQQQQQQDGAAVAAAATVAATDVPVENGAAPGAAPGVRKAAGLSAEEVLARGRQIFEELKEEGKDSLEMCYTALARMAAVAGDPTQAFQAVKDMQAAGVTPKLRSFTPALVGFAERGEFNAAAEVDAAIAACSLDLTEAEYARLMQAAARGATWEQGRSVLLRIGRELTTLQRPTLEHIQAFFESQAAQGAFEPNERPAAPPEAHWAVGECRVSGEGEVSPACGGRMRPVDLDPQEWVAFREGIASLAAKQERQPQEFRKFVEWLERHGPFGAVVDAANVAFFGQNFESGGFQFEQIRAVRKRLLEQHPGVKPLIILHNARTKSPPAQKPKARKLLEEMQEAGQFFATPTGSNDDWYWIYAAVAAGEHGILVSNDEMRDHIFQLLAPKFFLKWKQRHQVKYKFGVGGLQFEYPPPFTTCVQELDCGSWVLPAAEGPWLCARRVPPLPATTAAAPAAAAAEQQ